MFDHPTMTAMLEDAATRAEARAADPNRLPSERQAQADRARLIRKSLAEAAVPSRDGSLAYSFGHPEELCAICREEATDAHDGIGHGAIPICVYCANDRREPFQPVTWRYPVELVAL